MQAEQKKSRRSSLLRYLRLMNNLSLRGLSYKAKVNFTHLGEIECGTRECCELTARRLASFFGMDSEWKSFVTKPIEE